MKTLTPAYGRDYTKKTDVLKDYFGGKDFILNDITDPYDGKPCSCRDFPGETVKLRYNRQRSVITATWRPDLSPAEALKRIHAVTPRKKKSRARLHMTSKENQFFAAGSYVSNSHWILTRQAADDMIYLTWQKMRLPYQAGADVKWFREILTIDPDMEDMPPLENKFQELAIAYYMIPPEHVWPQKRRALVHNGKSVLLTSGAKVQTKYYDWLTRHGVVIKAFSRNEIDPLALFKGTELIGFLMPVIN